MKNYLYYHVYLTDDAGVWSSIVLEQLKCMEDAGLFEHLDKLRAVIITQEDPRLHRFVDIAHSFTNKLELLPIKNPYANDDEMLESIESEKSVTENITMQTIYRDAQQEDFRLCYIHTKGITAVKKQLLAGNNATFMKYFYWRQYLNWGVLERWQECVDALDTYDIAGVNYQTDPSPHYSGSFWWTTSQHIRSLPDPSTKDWWHQLQQETSNQWLKTCSDRFRDEQWPCSRKGTKAFNIHTCDYNPAARIVKRKEYNETI